MAAITSKRTFNRRRNKSRLKGGLLNNFKKAVELSKCDSSRLNHVPFKFHICLLPEYFGKKKEAINLLLSEELGKFNSELNGYPVAYDDKTIKFQEQMGKIIGIQTVVHCDVWANFIVFQPQVGCVFEAVVNTKTDYMVGCLIHERFYAAVHTCHNEKDSEWIQNIEYGDRIQIIITKMEKSRSGELIEKKSTPIETNINAEDFTLDSGIFSEGSKHEDEKVSAIDVSEDVKDVHNLKKIKKAKKRKIKEEIEEVIPNKIIKHEFNNDETLLYPQSSLSLPSSHITSFQDDESLIKSKHKKKKSKKKKHKETESLNSPQILVKTEVLHDNEISFLMTNGNNESFLPLSEINEDDKSLIKSKHKHKKSKKSEHHNIEPKLEIVDNHNKSFPEFINKSHKNKKKKKKHHE